MKNQFTSFVIKNAFSFTYIKCCRKVLNKSRFLLFAFLLVLFISLSNSLFAQKYAEASWEERYTSPAATYQCTADTLYFRNKTELRVVYKCPLDQRGTLMIIILKNFNGKGTYPLEQYGGDESKYSSWQGGNSDMCLIQGSVIVDGYDEAAGSISGSFDIRIDYCYKTSTLHFSKGTFRIGKPGMTLKYLVSSPATMIELDTLDLTMSVMEAGKGAAGAALYLKNPFEQSPAFKKIADIDSTGDAFYRIIIPTGTQQGNYFVEAYAEEQTNRTDTVDFEIIVKNELKLDIQPDGGLSLDLLDSATIKLIVSNNAKQLVEAAQVSVINPLNNSTSWTDIGVTDKKGELAYKIRTTDKTPTGDYLLKFAGKKQGSADASTAMSVTVGKKLYLSVQPDTTIIAYSKDTLTYRFTVTDKSKTPVKDAFVYAKNQMIPKAAEVISQTDAAGGFKYTLIIPDTTIPGVYPVKFWTWKKDYNPSSKFSTAVNIIEKGNCKLFGNILVCSESKPWELEDPDKPVLKTEGLITINDILCFSGSMSIDTNTLAFKGEGEYYIKDIPLPGGGIGKFTLYNGKYELQLLGEEGKITKFLNNQFKVLPKICGFEFEIKDLKLSGKKYSRGFEMTCLFTIPGIAGECGDHPGSSSKITFTGLKIERNVGFDLGGVKIENVGMYIPGFCLNDFSLSYDRDNDKFTGGANIGMPFGSVGGGVQFVKKKLDSLGWQLKASWPPLFVLGTTTVGISGFYGHVSNLTERDKLEVELGGIFSDIVSPLLYEINAGGVYKRPSYFELKGDMQIFKPPYLGIWQVIGSMSISYDFSEKMMELKGSAKLGTQDGKNYLISGDAGFKMSNKFPSPKFSGSLNGTIELPAFRPKTFPYNWLNSMFAFPIKGTTWARWIYGKEKLMYGEATFETFNRGPYKLEFVVNFNKEWGNEDFFYFKCEAGRTLSFVKSNIDNLEYSFSLDGKPSKDKLLAGDIVNNINIAAGTNLAVINIKSDTKSPVSSLTDPTGKVYTDATSVQIVALTSSTDGKESFWALLNPAAGKWVLTVTNPASNDSVFVYQTLTSKLNFKPVAKLTGNNVTVTWDKTGMNDKDTVYIMLDNDNKDYDGFHIAKATGNAGTANFSLSDTLSACKFYLFGIYDGESRTEEAYCDTVFINPRATLQPPTNVTAAFSVSQKLCTVMLTPTKDTTVSGYMIYVTDANGKDSLYAEAFAAETSISFAMADNINKKVKLVSFSQNGGYGCGAATAGIVTDVKDIPNDAVSGKIIKRLYPNPASNQLTIELEQNQDLAFSISLVDIFGNELIVISNNSTQDLQSGKYLMDIRDITSGIYFIRYQSSINKEILKVAILK